MLSFVGYDSDDECEDAEGIRYTRRNKGKKYALLQKDDSLEIGGAHGGSRDATRANGHMFSNNRTSHLGSNGAVANRMQSFQSNESSGEHHIHCPDGVISSEESSDIDAHVNSYNRAPNAGILFLYGRYEDIKQQNERNKNNMHYSIKVYM